MCTNHLNRMSAADSRQAKCRIYAQCQKMLNTQKTVRSTKLACHKVEWIKCVYIQVHLCPFLLVCVALYEIHILQYTLMAGDMQSAGTIQYWCLTAGFCRADSVTWSHPHMHFDICSGCTYIYLFRMYIHILSCTFLLWWTCTKKQWKKLMHAVFHKVIGLFTVCRNIDQSFM